MRNKKRVIILVVLVLLAAGFLYMGIKWGLGRANKAKGATFTDVPPDHWAYNFIEAAYRAGIIKGYWDGSFKPDEVVQRDDLAVFISRAVAGGDEKVPAGPKTPSYPDVSTSHWAYKYIEYVKTLGIASGYSDGKYHPEYDVTRDQTSVFISRAMIVAGVYTGNNLISNSSFEKRTGNNFDNWTEADTTPAAITADESTAQNASTSAKMTIASSASAYLQTSSTINIKPGTDYTLSYFAKTSVAGKGVYFYIKDNENYCFHSSGWDTNCSNNYPSQTLTADWQRYSFKITTRSSAKQITVLRIARSGTGDYAINVDSIQLEEGGSATEYNLGTLKPAEIDVQIPAGPETPTFKDVPRDNWAYKFIEFLAGQSIISGFDDGTFHPMESVTRAQIATFITKAFDLISSYLVANVSGNIKTLGGKPIANGYVVLDNGDDIAKTDNNGHYEFKGLDPGIHELQIFDSLGNIFESANLENHLITPDYGDNVFNFNDVSMKP